MPASTSPSFVPAGRNSSSTFAGFQTDLEATAVPSNMGAKGLGKMSKLPGGNKAIAAFALSLVAFTVQTEAAQYVQQGLGYRKPFLSLYLGHSSFMALLPLHLAFLRLHDPSRPLSHYLHLIAQNLHWQISAAKRANEKLPPTAERVRRRLSSLGTRENFDEDDEEEEEHRVSSTSSRVTATVPARPPKHKSWMEERCGFSPLRLLRVLAILTVGMTIPALSWYSAVPLTTMADITTIYNTYAVWALVFSVYFLGEKWERRKVLAVLLAVGGVVLVAYGGAEHRTKLREPDPVYGKSSNGTTTPSTTPPASVSEVVPTTAAQPVLGALLSLLGAVTMAGYEMAFALLGGLPDEAGQKARYAARAARRPRSSTIDYAYSRGSAEHEALLGDGENNDAQFASHHTLGDSDDETEVKPQPSSPNAKRAAPTVSVKSVPALLLTSSSDSEDAASDTGASASSLSDGEADQVAAGATRLGRAKSTSNLPTPISLPAAAAATVTSVPRDTARPQLAPRSSTKSLRGEDWMPPPLPFGLHANVMTSGIGAVTFFTLWLGIPIAHRLHWETFELPHNWTTVACLALVATMGIFFNGCFMILLSLWGPVLASVSCLLTTVLVFLADLCLGSEFRWLSLLGCGVIAAGFGVLVSGDGMATH